MPIIAGKDVGEIGYGLMGLTWAMQKPGGVLPSQDQSFKAMDAALESGTTLWNGGEIYGTPERNSLHLLHEYFVKNPSAAEKVVISIKGGLKPGTFNIDGSEAGVERSINECIKVLGGAKKLDLFECARVDPKTPIEITVGAMVKYIEKGQLGGISLSECSADTIRRASKVHKISAVEVEFSMWATDIMDNDVAKACAECQIPIIAYSPLGRGFLTGQYRSRADMPEDDPRLHYPRFSEENFDKNLEMVRRIEAIAKRKGVTAGQVGIAWVIAQGKKPGMPVIIPIPGASREDRVKENSVHVSLTEQDLSEIDGILKSLPPTGGRYPESRSSQLWGDSPPFKK